MSEKCGKCKGDHLPLDTDQSASSHQPIFATVFLSFYLFALPVFLFVFLFLCLFISIYLFVCFISFSYLSVSFFVFYFIVNLDCIKRCPIFLYDYFCSCLYICFFCLCLCFGLYILYIFLLLVIILSDLPPGDSCVCWFLFSFFLFVSSFICLLKT